MDLKFYHEAAAELEKRLQLNCFPLAIKLLEKETDIPEGARRPKKDFGFHLMACQGFAMSRRQGFTLAQLKEDMWCVEPVIGFGFGEPPQHFLEGHNRYPGSVRNLAAGANWAQAFPRLEAGKYIGVVSAPLGATNFEPDVVMLYINPAQLTLLLTTINWQDGNDLTCRLSGHAACVYSIVQAIADNQYQVTSPCGGDRRRAMARDDELIFTMPAGKLEALLTGLKDIEVDYSFRLPTENTAMPEPALKESYIKLGKMLGMELDSARVIEK